MKICVFGAGAIGGYLAVELALAGNDVCLVARGPHLRAIQQNGLKLLLHGQERVAHLAATDDPASLGVQDFVICTLKAHQAYESAVAFAPLLGRSTAIVTAMNGIPWWYFYRAGGRLEGHHLMAVDPGGHQWKTLGPQRAIGCVVDPACHLQAPGVIVHQEFNRFTLGEPDGSRSERVLALSRTLSEAGFDAPVRDNVRWNVWLKLWGNVCFNPISALTGATLDRITGDPGLRALCTTMMLETRAVNEALGIQIPLEMLERRLNAAGSVVGHKMSMLQDLEAGKPMEIDALVTAVQEMGRLTAVPTPCIDAVLALVLARARGLGLYAPLAAS
ncbi:MAG TPA: 2-dehydropantoate 2-reductase [Steroidobacteraceae bacterium]|nr:2-dehydropantoate 2-reductase [Steroidobacteraceae bacterium]